MKEREKREIEKLAEVYFELSRDFEKEGKKSLAEEMLRRANLLLLQLNQLSGPLVTKKEKPNCFFVKNF